MPRPTCHLKPPTGTEGSHLAPRPLNVYARTHMNRKGGGSHIRPFRPCICPWRVMDADRLYADWMNERRAKRRRDLYASDPIWRLTKLKAKWEFRERKRRAGLINARVDGKRVWIPAPLPQSANSEGVR